MSHEVAERLRPCSTVRMNRQTCIQKLEDALVHPERYTETYRKELLAADKHMCDSCFYEMKLIQLRGPFAPPLAEVDANLPPGFTPGSPKDIAVTINITPDPNNAGEIKVSHQWGFPEEVEKRLVEMGEEYTQALHEILVGVHRRLGAVLPGVRLDEFEFGWDKERKRLLVTFRDVTVNISLWEISEWRKAGNVSVPGPLDTDRLAQKVYEEIKSLWGMCDGEPGLAITI